MNDDPCIGDLIETLIDYRGKTPSKSDSGVRLITAKVIKGGRITSDRGEFIAEETYDSWMRRGLPRSGDILITTEAPLGEVAQIGQDTRVALAQRVILLRPDPQKVDPQFLFHYLRSTEAQDRLRQRASGTTVTGIRQPELRAVKVSLLARPNQEKVGQVLDSLENLIDNNRRRVELLEQMARAIYREWFVHFRYPGHENRALVDSPVGPIPEGWAVRPLVESAQITMGQSPRSEFYNSHGEGTPFHQGVTDFGAHFPTHRKYCTVDGRTAVEGDVLVSVRAPVGRLNLADTRIVIGRGIASVRSREGLQALLLANLREVFAEEDSMGGGTIFKAIGKGELEQVGVLAACPTLAQRANTELAAQFAMIRGLTFANRRLAEIRDLLLPRLVSGRIDVSSLDLAALLEQGAA